MASGPAKSEQDPQEYRDDPDGRGVGTGRNRPSPTPIDKSSSVRANTATILVMPPFDMNAALEPISAAAPCGIDLEDGNKYDPAFAELERIAIGKPEQQIGNTLVPAESPDWKTVQQKSTEILARSKDLRVATHLAKSLLRTDAWAGFAQGLELLRGLVEHYWDGMYPRLDPEDGNDPTMRVNILMSVTDPAILSALRGTALVSSRALGRFSLKDLEIALGEPAAQSSGDQPATMASLEAAAAETELGALEETTAAVRACLIAVTGLEAAIASRVASADALSFTKVAALIRKAEAFLAGSLARRAPPETPSVEIGHPSSVPVNGAGKVAKAGKVDKVGWTGDITSRDEVLQALDAISAYYEKYEPSSPIPIFMVRCKRLVTMGFVDIVRDLVPDALSQVDVLRGRAE
jgi:type VI secretion system protein ImpA